MITGNLSLSSVNLVRLLSTSLVDIACRKTWADEPCRIRRQTRSAFISTRAGFFDPREIYEKVLIACDMNRCYRMTIWCIAIGFRCKMLSRKSTYRNVNSGNVSRASKDGLHKRDIIIHQINMLCKICGELSLSLCLSLSLYLSLSLSRLWKSLHLRDKLNIINWEILYYIRIREIEASR